MLIAIAHNQVTDSSLPDERDVLVQAETVSKALLSLGHQPVPIPCNLDLSALKLAVERLRPDCIFNLVESLDGRGQLIFLVPSLFDALGVIYTGSPSASIYLTSHKVMAKEKMRAAGLPTPDWVGPYPFEPCSKYGSSIRWPKGPWIIKSVWEHASIGLTGDGLVVAERPEVIMDSMRIRAPELAGACFAELYIEGREFNLSILAGTDGPKVLPPAEIIFEGYQEDRAHIVCYKAKWDEQSFEYSHTPRRFDFTDEDTLLLKELEKLAIQCWKVFGLKGYARVDFRVDKDGRPFILEVNANPCLSPDAGFAAAISRAGMSFDSAVECIINDVMGKGGHINSTKSKSDGYPTSIKDTCFRYEPCMKDVEDIRRIIVETNFFHPYEVEVAIELVEERLTKGPASDYYFVFLEKDDQLIGYSCYGPIPCTASSYDLYWIAVDPVYQRKGAGKMILDETERLIGEAGGTRVYVDTSQSEIYNTTRAFYQRCGYVFESVLEDFYAPGDGKLVCCKVLSP
ncbi:GCN5-related N-acetyltransferase [uncultured Desulfobacterium sp.]|uniref:GCN5-related N-acetyltransferase n=1 Tax=uncultured Desulfobacterium sp. TaxID=201089 RepID=A0A445MUP8_9BACT|nr:GCN5-related N-acetyltransferase [uncultured Desulfobacterium sp.]